MTAIDGQPDLAQLRDALRHQLAGPSAAAAAERHRLALALAQYPTHRRWNRANQFIPPDPSAGRLYRSPDD